MKYFLLLCLSVVLFAESLPAQTGRDTAPAPVRDRSDSSTPVKPRVHRPDTLRHRRVDSLHRRAAADTARQGSAVVMDSTRRPVKPVLKDSARTAPMILPPLAPRPMGYLKVLQQNPFFDFSGKADMRVEESRPYNGKDQLFYLFAAMLFFFAVVKAGFSKYLDILFTLAFRASLKQKQLREQLLQTPLPSLMFNIFFTLAGGLYIVFLIQYHHLLPQLNFWLMFLYCSAGVGLIYSAKFMALQFTGWVFNKREATNAYIFIVFMVNKLLGIFLFPLLLLMAFASANWLPSVITLSYMLVVAAFLYRYLVAYAPVRKEAKVSGFHFFVYLCAFEIAPLLLIYKVLLSFI